MVIFVDGDKPHVNGEDAPGVGEEIVQEEEDDGLGYDRTRSFFDNISCDATDKSKG